MVCLCINQVEDPDEVFGQDDEVVAEVLNSKEREVTLFTSCFYFVPFEDSLILCLPRWTLR